jgi:myo-inositol-1(or 4)-monophosphatase
VIAQEAGGFVTGSKDVPHDGVVTEAILTGRRYLVIRGVAGTSVCADPQLGLPRSDAQTCFLSLIIFSRPSHPCTQEESSLDVQKRIAREFYDTVEDIPLDE